MKKALTIDAVRNKAEGYFERGEFFCSEAVVHTINELLGWPYGKDVVRLASAFPIGLGKSGCLCGAVSGGAMALGMAYGREHGEPMNEKMFPVSAALHDHIRDVYKITCLWPLKYRPLYILVRLCILSDSAPDYTVQNLLGKRNTRACLSLSSIPAVQPLLFPL